MNKDELKKFFNACGINQEPIGWYFTDEQPLDSIHPKESNPPQSGAVNNASTWSCVIQHQVYQRILHILDDEMSQKRRSA